MCSVGYSRSTTHDEIQDSLPKSRFARIFLPVGRKKSKKIILVMKLITWQLDISMQPWYKGPYLSVQHTIFQNTASRWRPALQQLPTPTTHQA